MTSKLDPQLAFLSEGGAQSLADRPAMLRFGLEMGEAEGAPAAAARRGKAAAPPVQVLVQYSGEPEVLEKAGLRIRSVNGDVISGVIAVDRIAALSEIAQVERMEAARTMQPDLDLSIVECRANLVHVGPPGRRGAGVIVGIVDSGIDFTHPSFRHPDGTSRILFLWAQGLTPRAGENSPAPFGYGVEYGKAAIDAALASATPFNAVRHQDPPPFHGTHVAGIAAGDASAPGQGRPAFTFVGVAPEADLIVVSVTNNGPEGLGTSSNVLDAVNYVFTRAGTLNKPAVVNMSLGDNLGPHDGTSLLERGIDNLLGAPGRAFVKSAGNAGADDIHAQGTVATGATVDVLFNQPAGNNTPDQMDVWYRGSDTLRVSIVDPAGNVRGPVNVGAVANLNFPGGNIVRVDHRNNDPFNGDKRVFITIQLGSAATIAAGNWRLRLFGVSCPGGGRFDAWIQRGPPIPRFLAPHVNSARTISTPGTARKVITAANYITRGAGVGSLASSSSRGPTRDGRQAPTLAAPGQSIISARGHFGSADPYVGMGGTSMAAPHIAGTIALMFQKNRNRTQDQIRQCLESTARTDAQTGPVPNTAWGAGKLDSNAAVNCVPSPGITPSSPVVCQPSVVVVCSSQIAACRPSVATICQTVTVTCQPSVATFCQPSVATVCQPSVATLCPTTPGQGCVASAITQCPTLAGCPSAVDGCPSTPGGCQVSVAGCTPTVTVINPTVVAGPVVVRPTGTATGPVAPPTLPGTAGRIGAVTQSEGEEAGKPELPPEGYFEYDEGWFDKS
jgi:subtilisin family serine protease